MILNPSNETFESVMADIFLPKLLIKITVLSKYTNFHAKPRVETTTHTASFLDYETCLNKNTLHLPG